MSSIGMFDEPFPGWEGLETTCGLYEGTVKPDGGLLNYTALLDGDVKCELFADYDKWVKYL